MSRVSRFCGDRRSFLKVTAWSTLASSAALHSCAETAISSARPTFDPGAVPERPDIFDLGVQSGLTSTGALLWTHLSTLVPLSVRVWLVDGAVVLDAPMEAPGAFVKLAVEALDPGGAYAYAFVWVDEVDGDVGRSMVGTFRMPPEASSLMPLTLAASACTHPSRMPFVALEETARHDFDLFCHLGDISYNDDAVDRASYDEAWALTLGDPGYRAVLPRAAFVPVIDDHEISNNFVVADLPPDQLAAGLAAIYDHLPMDGEVGDPLWTSHRWGLTAEIFVLDSRTERHRDQDLYLSEAQLSWLIEGITSSPCHFKILLNSVPIATLPPGWPGFGDRWEAYPAQRDALLDSIVDQGIENVWFLTGDLHAGLVHRVEGSGPRSGLVEIMVGPGGPRTLNPLPTLVNQVPDEIETYFPSDQFLYRSDQLAATLLTFDPIDDQVRVRFIDPETGASRYDELLKAGPS
jgi:phosphodiesterase/alkaline phosphatase D-like protein